MSEGVVKGTHTTWCCIPSIHRGRFGGRGLVVVTGQRPILDRKFEDRVVTRIGVFDEGAPCRGSDDGERASLTNWTTWSWRVATTVGKRALLVLWGGRWNLCPQRGRGRSTRRSIIWAPTKRRCPFDEEGRQLLVSVEPTPTPSTMLLFVVSFNVRGGWGPKPPPRTRSLQGCTDATGLS